jgi:hypothetical protein
VFALLAQRVASAAGMRVVHGMQEVSGSSPLSSTRNTWSGRDLRPVGYIPRSSDRHLTVVLGTSSWHWTARIGSRCQHWTARAWCALNMPVIAMLWLHRSLT